MNEKEEVDYRILLELAVTEGNSRMLQFLQDEYELSGEEIVREIQNKDLFAYYTALIKKGSFEDFDWIRDRLQENLDPATMEALDHTGFDVALGQGLVAIAQSSLLSCPLEYQESIRIKLAKVDAEIDSAESPEALSFHGIFQFRFLIDALLIKICLGYLNGVEKMLQNDALAYHLIFGFEGDDLPLQEFCERVGAKSLLPVVAESTQRLEKKSTGMTPEQRERFFAPRIHGEPLERRVDQNDFQFNG